MMIRFAATAARFLFLRGSLAGSIAIIVLAAGGGEARAAYLTPTYESQLEGWLGEGNLNFNLIFEKAAGDGKTTLNFHAAADGQGRTITLIKVADVRDVFGNLSEGEQFIGGYNPQSWSSIGDYNYTPNNAARTAFLFNLTDDVILNQKLNDLAGQYQTLNYSVYGPTFGGGHDLHLGHGLNGYNANMEQGYGYGYSYGTGFGTNVFGGVHPNNYYFSIVGFEVYTLSPANANAVPAPPGAVLACVGAMTVLGWVRFRRRPPVAVA